MAKLSCISVKFKGDHLKMTIKCRRINAKLLLHCSWGIQFKIRNVLRSKVFEHKWRHYKYYFSICVAPFLQIPCCCLELELYIEKAVKWTVTKFLLTTCLKKSLWAVFSVEAVKKFQKTNIYLMNYHLKRYNCIQYIDRKIFSQNTKRNICKSKFFNMLC